MTLAEVFECWDILAAAPMRAATHKAYDEVDRPRRGELDELGAVWYSRDAER